MTLSIKKCSNLGISSGMLHAIIKASFQVFKSYNLKITVLDGSSLSDFIEMGHLLLKESNDAVFLTMGRTNN